MVASKSRARKYMILGLTGGFVFLFGLVIGRGLQPKPLSDEHVSARPVEAIEAQTIWTCSMHPQIRQPEPGKCPICQMDLIPAAKENNGQNQSQRMMTMTPDAMRLAEIQTSIVTRKFVDVQIPLIGKVDYDQTRLKTIAAWVPGRLERLFVDSVGVPVRKGDHLVRMYSPELYAAQEEYLQAINAVNNLEGSGSQLVRRSTEKTVDAAREKLRLLGFSPAQITALDSDKKAESTVQINAPVSGIVIQKSALEGAYVKTGSPIYTVADLSIVWIVLDAYESNVGWLRYGQTVEIKTEAYGDRIFSGWISFIDPILNPQTRTINVRAVVTNPDGMLRPNMFARAVVQARVADGGEIISNNLQGKWISPMHPQIIKDASGTCDICGMPLVKADSLGYISEKDAKEPLVIPASAVLTTGKRSIVYVRVPDDEQPTFEGVEVEVGLRAGDDYIINAGLKEGQEVVTNGNFKIDSALQLLAKPSMMNPADNAATNDNTHNAQSLNALADKSKEINITKDFLVTLAPLYDAYLKVQQALANDNENDARAALSQLSDVLGKIKMNQISGDEHMLWMEFSRNLKDSLAHRMHMADIAGVRKVFLSVSDTIVAIERQFGHAGNLPHRIAFCPMADDGKGAEWVQTEDRVNNPYYGAAMLRCGEIRQTIAPAMTMTHPATAAEGSHEQQK